MSNFKLIAITPLANSNEKYRKNLLRKKLSTISILKKKLRKHIDY